MSILARPQAIEAVQLPAEIAFLLTEGIPYRLLERAADLARSSGTDAATALLHAGWTTEEVFYRALARRLGTVFLDAIVLGQASRYPQILDVGAAPLQAPCPHPVVAAPRGRAIARLIERCDAGVNPPALTTPTRLRLAAFAHHAGEIAAAASDELAQRHPQWSCRPGARPRDLAFAGAVIGLVLVAVHLPTSLSLLLLAALQAVTLAMLTLRLSAASIGAVTEAPRLGRPLPDDRLPTYTVIVALYREAKVVDRLVHALAKLDYPVSKLQIMFLIEADDAETAAAFRKVPMPARFEVVTVPDGLPRTKPRALNVALKLARGDLLVVYDAEDVVETRQLRDAATAFSRAPGTLAAVQGRLVIDNAGDGILTKFFAIEYSALFDVLGPALAAWRMPTPLGGTSTHFRTRILRELNGWDSWNVTEDADLGMRIALAGYHVGDLPSATFEEAPKKAKAWLHQRTRWLKGFLQTSFTHGRHARETARRLGALESFCALTLLPGTVLSALVYPFLMLPTAYRLLFGPEHDPGLLASLSTGTSAVVFAGGIAAMIVPGALGCVRRKWWDLLPLVPLLPLYFLMVSLAAWLAVFELARHPHRWNKTEHGLSKTSRSGALQLKRTAATAGATAPRPSAAAAVAG